MIWNWFENIYIIYLINIYIIYILLQIKNVDLVNMKNFKYIAVWNTYNKKIFYTIGSSRISFAQHHNLVPNQKTG